MNHRATRTATQARTIATQAMITARALLARMILGLHRPARTIRDPALLHLAIRVADGNCYNLVTINKK